MPKESKQNNSHHVIESDENNIPLYPQSSEEFHLLNRYSLQVRTKNYRCLHIGCVHVTIPYRQILIIRINLTFFYSNFFYSTLYKQPISGKKQLYM